MSFNPQQFRELVVRRVLQRLHLVIPYSKEAEDLLVMTAAHESHLGTYLKQVNGPALGVYQMEPATHDDIWYNYLIHRRDIRRTILDEADSYLQELVQDGKSFRKYDSRGLIMNLAYATAMARVHYYRVPEPLPKHTDFETKPDYVIALAKYAKQYYNTSKGKATFGDYYNAYMKLDRGE